MTATQRPKATEYPAYAAPYINRLPADADPLALLADNLGKVSELILSIPVETLDKPFAPAEWTVKEILIHIMDQERVYVYRALRFARRDTTELTAMDHEAYVKNSNIHRRDITSILEEYFSIRQATLSFFRSLNADDLDSSGKIGGEVFTVRGILWLAAAHETHHLDSIRQNYQNI